ncbi:hypothetical protein Tco_0154401 [Tanacetum coccineum]
MIGSLMYLTASRPDIQFSTYLYTRYQAYPKGISPYYYQEIFRKSTSVDAGCCANILWMKSQLTDYDIIYEKVLIFCDNTSAISISNNPVLHSRTRHTDIRDHILKGDIELHFIPTQCQLVDIFTKPLDELTFKRLIVELASISEVTEQSHMSHSWICMSTYGFVAFARELVLNFISKCCLKEAFTRSTIMYKEYLVDFWYTAKVQKSQRVWFSTPSGGTHGEVGLTSFKNAIRANYLAHSRDYAQTPSIEDVRAWFPSIWYGEEIETKGTLRKAFLPPRWRLLMA